MTRKFIGYFRLLDACAVSGCPVCRCVIEDGRRHLDALTYEQVNDVETRRRLRAAWGLCNWHTWTLARLPVAKAGSAIIYDDLLRIAAERVGTRPDRRPPRRWRWLEAIVPARSRLAARYRQRVRCLVCLAAHEGEARYVETAVDFADDPQFARAYADSAGLCVPHAVQAVERCPGRPEVDRLLDMTIRKWRRVSENLRGFVGKHEYRNTGPISEAEASACAAAFEVLAGAEGVFGNDLHGERPGDDVDRRALQWRVGELERENAELRAALLGRGGPHPDHA